MGCLESLRTLFRMDGVGSWLIVCSKKGEHPEEIDSLTRLSIVGQSGMGALTYKPVYQWNTKSDISDHDRRDAQRKVCRQDGPGYSAIS